MVTRSVTIAALALTALAIQACSSPPKEGAAATEGAEVISGAEADADECTDSKAITADQIEKLGTGTLTQFERNAGTNDAWKKTGEISILSFNSGVPDCTNSGKPDASPRITFASAGIGLRIASSIPGKPVIFEKSARAIDGEFSLPNCSVDLAAKSLTCDQLAYIKSGNLVNKKTDANITGSICSKGYRLVKLDTDATTGKEHKRILTGTVGGSGAACSDPFSGANIGG